jgi:transposase InsO family protein
MVGPAAKREGVAHLQAALGLSERRACNIVNADRKMIRYRSCRPPDTELRLRLRDLANKRKRFGYRRLFVLLRQEGESSGINRIYRLYREEGLTVRKRRARRRAVGARAPILVEAKPSPGNAWRQSRTPQSRDAGFSNFLFSTQPFLARCVKHWQHNGCKGRKSISQHTPC